MQCEGAGGSTSPCSPHPTNSPTRHSKHSALPPYVIPNAAQRSRGILLPWYAYPSLIPLSTNCHPPIAQNPHPLLPFTHERNRILSQHPPQRLRRLPGSHHQGPPCLGQAHEHQNLLHLRITMPETPFVCPTFFETNPTPKTINLRHEPVFQNESIPRLSALKRVPRFPTRS